MGGHATVEDPASRFFLRGWRGDEDEEVDIDITEESSEGEVEMLKRQTVANVHEPASLKKGRDSAETSAPETSDVADSAMAKTRAQRGRITRELEQASNNTSTAAKKADVKKLVEKPGTELLPGETSSTRSASGVHPRKLNDGKRLNARGFRNHFAAKLIRSKKATTAEGDGAREASGTLKDKIVPRSPSPRADSKAFKTSSSEQEEGTVNLHVNLEVEQEKDSDFNFNGNMDFGNPQNCKVFTRKRKQLGEGATKDGENEMNDKTLGQKKNGSQMVRSSEEKNSETRSNSLQDLETTLDDSSKDASNSGRSKRARKNNRQTDFIPWSDFGRVSARKEACAEDAPDSEIDSKHKGSKSSMEKEPILPHRERRAARQSLSCEGVEINQHEHDKELLTAIGRNSVEKEQTVDVQENQLVLSPPATVEEPQVANVRNQSTAATQEIANQQSRGLEDAALQDEGMKECGNASEPPASLETEVTAGTGTSQHKTGTDCHIDVMDEQETVHEGQSALSEKLLREEDSIASMKGVVEKDTIFKSKQAGAKVVETVDNHGRECKLGEAGAAVVEGRKNLTADDHDKAFKITEANSEIVEHCKGVAADSPDRAFKIQQAGAEVVDASKIVAADDHDSDRVSKIQQAGAEVVEASKIVAADDHDSDRVSKIQQAGAEVSKGSTADFHDSVCKKCKQGGNLICCDGKDCTVTFHIYCLDPPLIDVPPNDWYCPDCAYKRIVVGIHSVSKGIESIWGVKEGDSDESSLNSKECSAQEKVILQQGTKSKDGTVGEALEDKNQVEAEQGSSMLKMVEVNNTQSEPATKSANDTICSMQKSLSGASCAEKMYFVKFKGVAHVHNLWLGESHVLKVAPKLLHNFKKLVDQGKAPQWDPDWAKPFRVIGKRKTMLPSGADLSAIREAEVVLGHIVEWCIKWRKLGYEFCTWEVADRMPLKSANLKKIIDNFQIRSDKAKRRSKSETTFRVGALSTLKAGPVLLPDEHQSQKEAVEKLLCNWQKHIHSILVNEMPQDRMRITAGFLLCLLEQCLVTKPCLVVVPAPSLAEWRTAFHNWMPGTVVLYSGSKEARRIIQRYEFYNEEGICMVQIALTSFDTLNLDLEVLKELKLEAVIVDECQRLKENKIGKSVREIGSSFRLLLFSEPFKDTADDYHSVLALLSSGNGPAGGIGHTASEDISTLVQLKAAVSQHIVQESMQGIPGPKELWVPVKMTAFQVEEYCKLLIDNCDMLTRNKRHGDIASSPHELLLKIRECCNHPYLVRPSLQESLRNPTAKELLDFGIGASGKLKLLDMMLSEAKASKKRVVIITRVHLRVNKISLMDILDDYIRQQFGIDSYERLDGGLDKSKKSAAMQRFNALDSKSFVFLLDRRVCGPTIKLRSVNCIVIFDSDWNPQTDIHALLRMHSTGDLKHMAICRFYCPYTVEERVLISTRRDSDLDSNHHNYPLGLCHKLLRWGAQKTFELFDSHSRDKDKAKLSEELNYSNELVNLFLGKDLSGCTPDSCSNTALLKTAFTPRLAGQYNKGPPLLGETNKELLEEEKVSATEFWTDLLRDRLAEAPDGQVRELRARKKVQYHEDSFNITNSTKAPEEEEESRRKRRRVAESTDLTSVSKFGKHMERVENPERAHTNKYCDGGEKSASQKSKLAVAESAPPQTGSDEIHVNPITSENRVAHGGAEASGVENASESITDAKTEQQQLLLTMKADLVKLCQALQFQADTAGHVEQLRLSVGNFFKLPRDESLLHAIELSLCWLAAEQQHYSIDRPATLAIAEKLFGIQLDKIDTVYAKLEERWKKRLEQGAPLVPGPRGHNMETSHHGNQNTMGQIPDLNPLRDKHGPLQAPLNPVSPEDRQMVSSVQNVQEVLASTDASLSRQGPCTSMTPEQQQVSAPCEANTGVNDFGIQPSNEQAQPVPSFQEPGGTQEPFSGANRTAFSQHQLSMNEKQRSERTQALIHAQKTQLRSLDLLENSYKQKLKAHYESAVAKLPASRRASSGELMKLLEGLKSASRILTTSFTLIRNNLIKKQQEERDRANKLITSLLERHSAGEAVNACVFENIDFSERSIYDSLPNGLKGVLESGDFATVLTTSGSGPAGSIHAPVTMSSSSPIPLPPQPQSQSPSHAQLLSRQPQLQPELQQTQTHHGGLVVPPLHAHQQISGSALAPLNEAVQPSSTSTAHQQTVPHPSIRVSAAGTSATIRMPHGSLSRPSHQYQNDPLAQEFLRLRKEQDKAKNAHELEKERIKGQFMKELEVLSKKYEGMLQEEDSLYTQKAAALEQNLKKVEMNRRLAEVFRVASQDSSLLNTAALGQDVRMLLGAATQHTPPLAIRTPLTTQSAVLVPSMPLMPAAAVASASMFERPALAPTTSIAGSQLAGTPIGNAWHQSHGQSTSISIGLRPHTANAVLSAGLIAGPSGVPMQASGQQSPLFLQERNRLLASWTATQPSAPINIRNQISSAVAGISNTRITSVTAASTGQVQDSQTLNLGGNHSEAMLTQDNEGLLGRIPTACVQTHATLVTPHRNPISSPILGDSEGSSQAHAGVSQDGHVSLGIIMPPVPEFPTSERLTSGILGMEISRPPSSHTEELLQADENRYNSQVNYGLLGQDALIAASFHLPTVQGHVINGSAPPTSAGHVEEGRNNAAPSDVICLSDDD